MVASDRALAGSAGVHYVAFQLASRGFAIGLTTPGVRAVDLMAGNGETGKSISIQVKTMTDAHVDMGKPAERWKWHVGKQLAEGARHKALFVLFVNLRGGPPVANDSSWDPEVFILPSTRLDNYVWGYPEKSPRDFWFVIPVKDAYKYRNKWDLIENALA